MSDTLIEGLGYDSLSLMELAFALEETFELEPISAEDTVTIETVDEVAAYVAGEVEAGRGQVPSPETLATNLDELL